MTLHPALPLALLLGSGCVLNSERHPRPRDLEPAWLIAKPRLLGVAAEPAEPRPGESVQFRALIADPTDEVRTVLWTACVAPDGDGGGFGCVDQADPQLIGAQPGLDPSYTAPADLLDDLPPEDRAEGRYVLVQVTALGEVDLTDPDFDPSDVDFNQVEAGYKRLVVSDAPTPNTNPRLAGFTVDGVAVLPGAVLEVDPHQPYDLGAVLDDDTLESYTYINSAGQPEQRVEQPYVSWFATAGTVTEPATLYPYLESTWNSPDSSGVEGVVYAVVRDRRGGMAWQELRFRVR